MDRANIVSTLKTFIENDILEGADVALEEHTPLLKLRLIDSFSVLELLSFIDKEFNIEIHLETLSIEDLKSIGSIADLILSAKSQK